MTDKDDTGTVEQELQPTQSSDNILGQDKDLQTGVSARDPDSCHPSSPKSQQADDPDAGVSAQDPKPTDESDHVTPTNVDDSSNQQLVDPHVAPCPLGSAHAGCMILFIPCPGYSMLTKSKARVYQRTFKRARDRLGCAYAAHMELNPNAGIPAALWQHTLPPQSSHGQDCKESTSWN